jgi:hypothetical protein
MNNLFLCFRTFVPTFVPFYKNTVQMPIYSHFASLY